MRLLHFHHNKQTQLRPTNRNPDLLEPYILRSLSNIEAVSIHTSCNGCHFVVLDITGAAWLFGRNGFGALGIPSTDDHVSENAPMRLIPADLGAAKGTKFVHAACGRNHTLLVGSDGNVWSAGANALGQVCKLSSSDLARFSMDRPVWTLNMP